MENLIHFSIGVLKTLIKTSLMLNWKKIFLETFDEIFQSNLNILFSDKQNTEHYKNSLFMKQLRKTTKHLRKEIMLKSKVRNELNESQTSENWEK